MKSLAFDTPGNFPTFQLLRKPLVWSYNRPFPANVAQSFKILYFELAHEEGYNKGSAARNPISAVDEYSLFFLDGLIDEGKYGIKVFLNLLPRRVFDFQVEVVELLWVVHGKLFSCNDNVFDPELFEHLSVLGADFIPKVEIVCDLIDVRVEH